MVQKSLLIKAARSARAGGRDHGSDRNKSAVCVSVSRARAEHAVYAPAHWPIDPSVRSSLEVIDRPAWTWAPIRARVRGGGAWCMHQQTGNRTVLRAGLYYCYDSTQIVDIPQVLGLTLCRVIQSSVQFIVHFKKLVGCTARV